MMKVMIFFLMLFCNTLIAVLYLVFGLLRVRRRGENKRTTTEIKGIAVEDMGQDEESKIRGEKESGATGEKQEKEAAITGEKQEREAAITGEKQEKEAAITGEKTGGENESIRTSGAEGEKSGREETAGDEKAQEETAGEVKNQEETAGDEKAQEEAVREVKAQEEAARDEKDRKEGGREEKDGKENKTERKREDDADTREGRAAYVIRFVVMLLCPVVGILFFGIGHLLYLFVFRKDVSLEDVIFSKERVKTHERADEERERNMAPLEEAIAVSDKESLRNLMLNVIRGDIQSSLAAISLALNSPDSETSHYAASVLQDELNNFRVNVQKLRREIEKEEDGQTECEKALIPYMNNVLEQRVFTEMEQKNMVGQFVEAGEALYRKNRYQLTSQYYEWICLRLLDIRDFSRMEQWCIRAAEQYPDELSSYTCKLKLYFTAQQRDKFFETLDELKQSSIVIDRETLELIRTFG